MDSSSEISLQQQKTCGNQSDTICSKLWKTSLKGNLKIQTEIPKLEEFLMKIQRSWEEAMKSMEITQEMMKKQYDKK